MFASRWVIRRAGLVAIIVGAVALTHAASQQPRDRAVAASGTSTVAGVVVTDDPTPQPLRRTLVSVTGAELGVGRSAITDDDGRFAIGQLPAAQVTIGATKRGYVDGIYGAVRPGRPGTPVQLAAGVTLEVTIRLSRAAVLTGVIRDSQGIPVPGLRVFALDGRRPREPVPTRMTAGSYAMTDDRGVYRLYDLSPGEFVVAATPTASVEAEITRRSAEQTDALLARLRQRSTAGSSVTSSGANANVSAPVESGVLAPSYYPGTSSLRDAARVKVGSGEVRGGLDFTVTTARVTTIEGIIVGSGGLPSVQLTITPDDTLRFFALGGGYPSLVQPPGPDGRFKYTTVVLGHYVIAARANQTAPPGSGRGGAGGVNILLGNAAMSGRGGGGNTTETMYAVEDVTVTGQPIVGLTLNLQRGSRFSGRLVIDAASPQLPDFATIRVGLQSGVLTGITTSGSTTIGNAFAQVPAVAVGADGTFELAGVPPFPYAVVATVPPAAGRTWWLRSAIVGGRDVLDTGMVFVLGQDATEAVLTISDRHSGINGTLESAVGVPAPDYFIIVMPSDPALWTSGSRRVKTTRPATDGTFKVVDLPAGDYLVVALTDVAPDEWQQPEFLRSIASAGVKITLADGEVKTQNLRIR